MMRKTLSVLILTVSLATLLSGCITTAADAANKAGAVAKDAATSAGKVAAGAAASANKAAAGAAATAGKVSCEGLKGVNRAVGQVGSFSPDTAVSDVIAFKRKVDPFVNPIRVVSVTMGMDPVSQFILAYDAFGLLINSLPADANLGTASSALTASMAALLGATAQAEEALQCHN